MVWLIAFTVGWVLVQLFVIYLISRSLRCETLPPVHGYGVEPDCKPQRSSTKQMPMFYKKPY